MCCVFILGKITTTTTDSRQVSIDQGYLTKAMLQQKNIATCDVNGRFRSHFLKINYIFILLTGGFVFCLTFFIATNYVGNCFLNKL